MITLGYLAHTGIPDFHELDQHFGGTTPPGSKDYDCSGFSFIVSFFSFAFAFYFPSF